MSECLCGQMRLHQRQSVPNNTFCECRHGRFNRWYVTFGFDVFTCRVPDARKSLERKKTAIVCRLMLPNYAFRRKSANGNGGVAVKINESFD